VSAASGLPLRVLTLNTASGRGAAGGALGPAALAEALEELAGLGADVVALQEVDAGQERSGRAHQAELAARACGAADWRFAPALVGTPSPLLPGAAPAWHPAGGALLGPGDAVGEALFGVALLSRRPVRSWHALALPGGRAKLRLRAPDPRTGAVRWWSFPDEPRVAVAAVLEGGVSVACTHLSFSPPTAVRQLRRVRHWLAQAPGPVRLLLGDLNLPARLPALVAGGEPLVRTGTYPAQRPRLQLDHVLALQGEVTGERVQASLPLGDHRVLVVDVRSAA
jgi:endonuclease/exonuclease/phosphatase family metal-dependent hydrolase